MNVFTRRRFFQAASAAPLLHPLLSASAQQGAGADFHWKTGERPLVIATWPFGKPANERALEVLREGGSALDAVEKGINVTESDPGNTSVGLGGTPNAEGVVQLDACIMDGPTHKAGSVAAIERIALPISVARRVMEKTKHVMLVGPGAQKFATEQGFQLVPQSASTPARADRIPEDNHDTISLIALAANGSVAGGCSTSGLGRKLPGRVGDSPIIGSGLYVDNDVGGAGATGIGENIMRFCGSFQIVEFMRQGMHPTEACVATIKRIMAKHPPKTELNINFVALNNKGQYGAAGTGRGFEFAVAAPGFSKVLRSAAVPV